MPWKTQSCDTQRAFRASADPAGHWPVDHALRREAGIQGSLLPECIKSPHGHVSGRALGDAPKKVKIRHIGNCLKADPAYGKGVADALGIALSEVPK